jgi:hypothetical protein
MKASDISYVAIWAGIAGVILSIFLLAGSGAGDHPPAFIAYLNASAMVLGFGILAAAVAQRNDR